MAEKSVIEHCQTQGCNRAARLAFKRDRKDRKRVRMFLDFDDRMAPASYTRACTKHGREILGSLIVTLCGPDTDLRVAQLPVGNDGAVLPGLPGRSQAEVAPDPSLEAQAVHDAGVIRWAAGPGL